MLSTYVGDNSVFAKEGFSMKMAHIRDNNVQKQWDEDAMLSYTNRPPVPSKSLQTFFTENKLV